MLKSSGCRSSCQCVNHKTKTTTTIKKREREIRKHNKKEKEKNKLENCNRFNTSQQFSNILLASRFFLLTDSSIFYLFHLARLDFSFPDFPISRFPIRGRVWRLWSDRVDCQFSRNELNDWLNDTLDSPHSCCCCCCCKCCWGVEVSQLPPLPAQVRTDDVEPWIAQHATAKLATLDSTRIRIQIQISIEENFRKIENFQTVFFCEFSIWELHCASIHPSRRACDCEMRRAPCRGRIARPMDAACGMRHAAWGCCAPIAAPLEKISRPGGTRISIQI